MQTALIIMTILGCDDTATQCHYVEMLDERWANIQSCDAASEEKLQTYSIISYPVVVAVCQTPEDTGLGEVAGEPAAADAAPTAGGNAEATLPKAPVPKADIPVAVETSGAQAPKVDVPVATPLGAEDTEVPAAHRGLFARAVNQVSEILPDPENLKALVTGPVHVVADGYSWVARRFEK